MAQHKAHRRGQHRPQSLGAIDAQGSSRPRPRACSRVGLGERRRAFRALLS
jgi:hypothetical protein